MLNTLRKNGHIAYFAGGCVRDLLLGLEPKDYDVATDAPPARVREIFPKTQSVGAAFGVILVRQGKSVIEVATFRSDLSYADGRRPEGVRFSTPAEDAQRRDFTINGLFLDPITDEVIDYVNGQGDLKNRLLRAIGDPEQRFAEDHLRILRAVRFAARFDLQIESATATAINKNAVKLIRISPERIAEELRMMLCLPTRMRAYLLLWEFALPQVILRDLPERPVAGWTDSPLLQICKEKDIPFGFALALFVLDYRLKTSNEKSAVRLLQTREIQSCVRACRKDLKISNDEADMMSYSLDMAFLLEGEKPSVAGMKRFLARPHSNFSRMLLGILPQIDPSLTPRITWLLEEFPKFPESEIAPTPLITGEDLLAAGLRPGPLFKQILDQVYDAQLENKISTHHQAMDTALSLANQK